MRRPAIPFKSRSLRLTLFAVCVGLASSVPAVFAQSGEAESVTQLRGEKRDYQCRSVVLQPENAVGILVAPRDDEKTVNAKVLFKAGRKNRVVEMRLMKADADVLSHEVDAMLRNLRTAPIRIEAKTNRAGECKVVQVNG